MPDLRAAMKLTTYIAATSLRSDELLGLAAAKAARRAPHGAPSGSLDLGPDTWELPRPEPIPELCPGQLRTAYIRLTTDGAARWESFGIVCDSCYALWRLW